MLLSLPSSFGDLTNLRYLSLKDCCSLGRLPVTFKNLMLLQYLNLKRCRQLILMLDDFQNIAELEYLNLSECDAVEELPHHITNQVSLKELYLDGMKRLRELPIKIGELSRLQKLKIGNRLVNITVGSNLKFLPNSLGDLSSLTVLSIQECPNLKSLPTSLGNLPSLTDLSIHKCPNLLFLPTSLRNLSSLTDLSIHECPKLESLPASLGDFFSLTSLSIYECPKLEFLPSSVGHPTLLGVVFVNLKRMQLLGTEVCRISISKDNYPCLESLDLGSSSYLMEIQALPINLEWLHICWCPHLFVLPSFACLTSLKEFEVRGCHQIKKIEGLKYCTRLETLRLHTCWEVSGIESLEHMEKLRMVELRANKGSAIRSCIKTIQKWPDEIIMCTQAVSHASSLVDSLQLSPHLSVVDSFSNNNLYCIPELMRNCFSNRNAIMVCYVIDSVDYLQMQIFLERREEMIQGTLSLSLMSSMEIGKGRWAVVGVFTQRSEWLRTEDSSRYSFQIRAAARGWTAEVERGLAVTGEEQSLQGFAMEALRQLTY